MFFRFSALKIGGVLMRTFSKGSFTSCFQKSGPRGGGGVLPEFNRCGTNYMHTTLLKGYPKSNILDCKGMLFRFSAPKTGGFRMRTFSNGSFTRFPQKMAPGGGGRLIRFHQTWH